MEPTPEQIKAIETRANGNYFQIIDTEASEYPDSMIVWDYTAAADVKTLLAIIEAQAAEIARLREIAERRNMTNEQLTEEVKSTAGSKQERIESLQDRLIEVSLERNALQSERDTLRAALATCHESLTVARKVAGDNWQWMSDQERDVIEAGFEASVKEARSISGLFDTPEPEPEAVEEDEFDPDTDDELFNEEDLEDGKPDEFSTFELPASDRVVDIDEVKYLAGVDQMFANVKAYEESKASEPPAQDSLRLRVLYYLRLSGGGGYTERQMSEKLGVTLKAIKKEMADMQLEGLINWRPTKRIFTITAAGRQWLEQNGG